MKSVFVTCLVALVALASQPAFAAPAMEHIRFQQASEPSESNAPTETAPSETEPQSDGKESNTDNTEDAKPDATEAPDTDTAPENHENPQPDAENDNTTPSDTGDANSQEPSDSNTEPEGSNTDAPQSPESSPDDNGADDKDGDATQPDEGDNKPEGDNNEGAPASNDPGPDASVPEKGSKSADPCQRACAPRIDSKVSVIESYKRHRANVALIGDFGSCKPATDGQKYTWEIEWGDNESYEKELDHIGPFQAEHIYAKKGKYNVDVTFCAHTDGCDSGCTTIAKKIHVKP